ncbi:MAG TPA: TIGR03560 family F420-dependent LLM class oxidoreductase [Candidatus Sulfomarinibacteraceae bacterium]|nr:TIGR03560 family F420-dependent LLM class oxidoreductase [Candidatus Sulfomarinibacteraceae bacterium]
MRFGAAFWIQRTDWPSLRDAALAAEAAGFDSIWVDDHLLNDEGDPRADKLEGWTTLAGLATITSRVALGHLVAANTFRNPGLIAKQATTIDHLSGGRLVLGLGGGWFEREHDAFGFEFGAGFGERLDRLDEAVGLIRHLLDGETVTHDGRFYRMRDAICRPRPVQAHLPILIGGSGRTKTLRIAARYADLWNGYGEPERIAEVSGWLQERCAEAGRPFEEIRRSVVMDVVVRDTAAAARTAYAAVAERHGIAAQRRGADDLERGLGAGGPPGDVAVLIAAYAALGVNEVMWIFRDPFDLETIRWLPAVRAAMGQPEATSSDVPTASVPAPAPAPAPSSSRISAAGR